MTKKVIPIFTISDGQLCHGKAWNGRSVLSFSFTVHVEAVWFEEWLHHFYLQTVDVQTKKDLHGFIEKTAVSERDSWVEFCQEELWTVSGYEQWQVFILRYKCFQTRSHYILTAAYIIAMDDDVQGEIFILTFTPISLVYCLK